MDEKYKTIIIDPPWPVESLSKSAQMSMNYKGRLTTPYKKMPMKDIEAFPIDKFAAERDCCLFMWTTWTLLPTALEIIKKWNFKYHAVITWFKGTGINHMGIFRNSEPCIVSYRSNIPFNFGHTFPLVFRAPVTRHSAKPEKFYNMLLKSVPEPRIDIFARRRHYGYDAWGDQVEPLKNTLESFS